MFSLNESDDEIKNKTDDEIPIIFNTYKQKRMWIDKYSPKTINDFKFPDIFKKIINIITKSKYISNSIFVGNPGVGKTCLAYYLIKQILGNEYKNCLLDINSSDIKSYKKTGINNIDELIVNFCKKKTNIDKIILIDNVDGITKKTQLLISNIMNVYKNTKFIYICNDLSDIDKNIQSNCIIRTFPLLTDEFIYERLVEICNLKKIHFTKDGLYQIIENNKGDLRSSINNLQVCFIGLEHITKENVISLYLGPSINDLKLFITFIMKNDFKESFNIIKNIIHNGYKAYDILSLLLKYLLNMNIDENDIHLNDEVLRLKYIDIISSCFINITKGVNTNGQLYLCTSKLLNLKSKFI